MSVTQSLRRDHQILRAKLKLLEAAMRVAPEAQFALREMCWSLGRMLEMHIQREADTLRPYSNRIRALTQERMAHDHADQRVVLRDVNALLLGGIKAPVSKVVPPLAQLIEELKEHMEEEEKEVFPMVDRLAAEESLASTTTSELPLITEAMTVNHVLKVHPKAREIFEAFKVDCDADGCHCLEELYWRRGIDVKALLDTLNQSATESAATK